MPVLLVAATQQPGSDWNKSTPEQFTYGMGALRLGLDDTTETTLQSRIYRSGVISKFSLYVVTAPNVAPPAVTLRKNGANGNQTISVPVNTTGLFTDSSHTDTVAVGDLMTYRLPASGASNTGKVSFFSVVFTDDSNDSSRFVCSSTGGTSGSTFNTSSSTFYAGLVGEFNTLATADASTDIVPFQMELAGTVANMEVHIKTNTKSTCTARLRKNAANSNVVVSITANTTGRFSDTTNTEAISVGDKLDYSFSTGTGAGNMVILKFSCDFIATSGGQMCVTQTPTTQSMTTGSSIALPLSGDINAFASSTTEPTMQVAVGRICDASRMMAHITANSTTGSTPSTVTFRKNATDTSLVASIPVATTGYFTDTSNTVSLVATDLINYTVKKIPSGGVSIALASCGVKLTGGPTTQTLQLSAIASLEAVNALSLSTNIHVQPSAIASAEAVQAIPLHPFNTLSLASIASTEVVNEVGYSLSIHVQPSPIASAEAVNALYVRLGWTIMPAAIPSAEVVNALADVILGLPHLIIGNIPSEEAFGTITVFAEQTFSIDGIDSGELVYPIDIYPFTGIAPGSIASLEAFGVLTVHGLKVVTLVAIPSSEVFGDDFEVNAVQVIVLPGIATAEVVNPFTAKPFTTILLPAIASAEVVNALAHVTQGPPFLHIGGIPSEEAFGTLLVQRIGTNWFTFIDGVNIGMLNLTPGYYMNGPVVYEREGGLIVLNAYDPENSGVEKP